MRWIAVNRAAAWSLAALMGLSAAWAAETGEAVSVFAGPRAGPGRYRPGRWGIVTAEAVNRTDRPMEVQATVHFARDPHQQFARRLWVPPQSMRRSWCPAKTPEVPREFGAVEIVSLAVEREGKLEVLREETGGERRPSALLPVDHVSGMTAVVGHQRLPALSEEQRVGEDEVLHLVQAFHEAGGLPMIVVGLGEEFLTPTAEALDGLDYLVVAGDRLAWDMAAERAVRQWVLRGGTLWVMLDQVDPNWVARLLGDSLRFYVVDRVGLTTVDVEEVDPSLAMPDEEPREYEEPVELVRIVVSRGNVLLAVNGWPAAVEQTVGRGRVIVTTLGPRGWLRARQRGELPPPRAPYFPPWKANAALEGLTYWMVGQRDRLPAGDAEQLQRFVYERIGYRVVPRGTVFGLLGGFCVVLGGVAVWLRRRGRAERLIWVAPALALVAGVALAAVGTRYKRAVPPTVATLQVVYAEPGLQHADVTGVMALYNQRPLRQPIGAAGGGLLELDFSGAELQTRRMVWTDLDSWHWENLTLPPGIRTASFRCGVRLRRPVMARAEFASEGLTGTLDAGPFAGPEDGVLVFPGGRMAVRFGPEGMFTAGADEVLAADQFLADKLVDDTQRRRQAVYRSLWGRRRGRGVGRPLLMFWARPLDLQFDLPAAAQRIGSALVVVPLELQPTPPGTRVRVPAPCLPFRCVPGLDSHRSGLYNHSTGEWLASRTPAHVWLRFQVPPQVLPLRVDEAAVTLKLEAPTRPVELCFLAGKQKIALGRWDGPVGTLRVSADKEQPIRLDAEGGLVLGILVGEAEGGRPELTVDRSGRWPWRIEQVAVEVAGTVGGRESGTTD